MSRRFYKVGGLIVALSLLVSSLSGCGGKSTSTNGTTENSTSTQQAASTVTDNTNGLPSFPLASPITVKVMFPEVWGQQKIGKNTAELEKRTGIKFEYEFSPVDAYREKQSIVFASGDFADMVILSGTEKRSVREMSLAYGKNGMFVNYKDYMPEMSNFKNWTEKFPKMLKGVQDQDGNFYSILSSDNTNAVYESYIVNKAAFDKNSIPVPGSVDELYTSLKKLKEIYPESTPWIVRWKLSHLMDPMSLTFGSNNKVYYNKDLKKYTYGPIEDNYKKALEFLNKCYKDKLLDPEFTTLSDAQWAEKLLNNKAFFTFDYKHETRGVKGTTQYNAKQQNKADVNLVPIAPPKVDGKDSKYWGAEAVNPLWGVAINAKSKYVKELVKFMDYQYTEEFIDLRYWGIENESYRVVDGQKEYMPEIKSEENPDGKDLSEYVSTYFGVWGPQVTDFNQAKKDGIYDLFFNDQVLSTGDYPPEFEITLSSEEVDTVANLMTPIKTYCEENEIYFITGKLSFDKWSEYVNKVNEMGMDKILKIYNDAMAKVQQ